MPSLPGFIFFQKYIKDYIMYQGGELFQIVNITPTIFLHFWISIYNQLPKKSKHISKTLLMISEKSSALSQIYLTVVCYARWMYLFCMLIFCMTRDCCCKEKNLMKEMKDEKDVSM